MRRVRYSDSGSGCGVLEPFSAVLAGAKAAVGANETVESRRVDDGSADLFARLDDDGDGSLQQHEIRDSAEVGAGWRRLDRNRGGRIDREEFGGR